MTTAKKITKRIETSQGDILTITKSATRSTSWFGSYEFNCNFRDCRRAMWRDNFGGLWCKVDDIWFRSNAEGYRCSVGFYGGNETAHYEKLVTAYDFE